MTAGSLPIRGLVLDSLFDDLDVESQAAESVGSELMRWNGDVAQLKHAEYIVHVRKVVSADVVEHLEACRAIGRFGTGLDTVDLEAAARRGIPVVGVAGYATNEVAQHALALAFAVSRGVVPYQQTLSSEAWQRLPKSRLSTVDGPVGVVGFGAIGQRVAALYRGLGVEVLVTSRHDDAVRAAGLQPRSLPDLLCAAQVVSLHLPLAADTRHTIGATEVGLMREDAILVNTARGALLDHTAVGHALREGGLNGVGLDVFEPGTEAWWHELKAAGLNVVLTPHVGWYSPRAARLLRSFAILRTVAAARRQTLPSVDLQA